MRETTIRTTCDKCKREISERTGLRFHGNVLAVTEKDTPAGLIGNNFPEQNKFSADEVRISDLCLECMFTICDIDIAGDGKPYIKVR